MNVYYLFAGNEIIYKVRKNSIEEAYTYFLTLHPFEKVERTYETENRICFKAIINNIQYLCSVNHSSVIDEDEVYEMMYY